MTWKKRTTIFILISFAAIIIYDIIAYIEAGGSGTISVILFNAAPYVPVIPFIWCGLAVHFFIPSPYIMNMKRTMIHLGAVTIVSIITGIYNIPVPVYIGAIYGAIVCYMYFGIQRDNKTVRQRDV